MTTTEIKIGGFGGQGVILTGIIIGRAASIYDDQHATMTQAFGPEARGSACSSQVIVSDQAVLYPYVTHPRVLVVMSQEAFTKFSPEIAPDALLLYEEDLVKLKGLKPTVRTFGIPATRFAEELGRKMVLNIVMTGFFTAVTGLIGLEAMRDAVKDSVPPGTEGLNLTAFQKGYDYGRSLVEGRTAVCGAK
ncbi:MAG: 2-oxoacid:acceptor oxidoreductase family protein [Planctomycetota bacterium]